MLFLLLNPCLRFGDLKGRYLTRSGRADCIASAICLNFLWPAWRGRLQTFTYVAALTKFVTLASSTHVCILNASRVEPLLEADYIRLSAEQKRNTFPVKHSYQTAWSCDYNCLITACMFFQDCTLPLCTLSFPILRSLAQFDIWFKACNKIKSLNNVIRQTTWPVVLWVNIIHQGHSSRQVVVTRISVAVTSGKYKSSSQQQEWQDLVIPPSKKQIKEVVGLGFHDIRLEVCACVEWSSLTNCSVFKG